MMNHQLVVWVEGEIKDVGDPKVGGYSQTPAEEEAQGPQKGSQAAVRPFPTVHIEKRISREEEEGVVIEIHGPKGIGEGSLKNVEETGEPKGLPKEKPPEGSAGTGGLLGIFTHPSPLYPFNFSVKWPHLAHS